MTICHVALWTARLEELRAFYTTYFGALSGEKYTNPGKGFESYMLRFEGGAALELMRGTHVSARRDGEMLGWCHIALSVGSRERVVELTERLRSDGFVVLGEPRTTGDGFFESVVADPDGNRVEITI